jgi:hypothetical protein
MSGKAAYFTAKTTLIDEVKFEKRARGKPVYRKKQPIKYRAKIVSFANHPHSQRSYKIKSCMLSHS